MHEPGTPPQEAFLGRFGMGSRVGRAGASDCLHRPVCLGVGWAGAAGHLHRLVCPGRGIPADRVSRAPEGEMGKDGAVCCRGKGEWNGVGGLRPAGGAVSTRGLDIARG